MTHGVLPSMVDPSAMLMLADSTFYLGVMCVPSRAIRLMLHEYNLTVSFIYELENRLSQNYRALSPLWIIPGWKKGDMWLHGSLALREFVMEVSADPFAFFATKSVQRARIRQWVDHIEKDLIEGIFKPLFAQKIRADRSPCSDTLRHLRGKWQQHARELNDSICDRKWFIDERMSIVDFWMTALLSALDYIGEIKWSAYPHLGDFYAKVKSRPTFRFILHERYPGIQPAAHYAAFDF